MFGSACEKVFAIKVLNEESTHSKYQVVKCDASEDGDYIGLVVEGNTVTFFQCVLISLFFLVGPVTSVIT